MLFQQLGIFMYQRILACLLFLHNLFVIRSVKMLCHVCPLHTLKLSLVWGAKKLDFLEVLSLVQKRTRQRFTDIKKTNILDLPFNGSDSIHEQFSKINTELKFYSKWKLKHILAVITNLQMQNQRTHTRIIHFVINYIWSIVLCKI